jgi:predicted Ser/Thr protein kinase
MTQAYERLLQGRTLAGRYDIHEVIGSGGMSVVYRGVDRNLGRAVAIKVVSVPAGNAAQRDELRARFRREAGAAASIPHHPNVVQVYDYGTDPQLDLDFIIMELLEGRDLKQALAAGELTVPECVRILREAARGLAAGHRVGLVHRDVKPANVFLTGDGEIGSVCVLDFGIAKPLEADPEHDLTRTGHVAYSPAYASPEQLRGERGMTPASDVYQLGLIGYEMLAGARPFDEAERERIRAGDSLALPVRGRWATVPEALGAVLQRALRMRPEERFADAGAMAEALAHAADDRAVPHAAPHPAAETRTAADPAGHRVAAVATAPLRDPSPGVPVHASPVPPPRRGWAWERWAVPALVVLLVLGWAAARGGRGDSARADAAAAAGLAAPAAAAPAPRADSAAGVVTLSGGDARARAEAEIRQAVQALNQTWVDGEIRAHVGHYASRVDYYNSRRLARSGVRRDRQRELDRYDVSRRIDIHGQKVEWLDDDRARVRVDKAWDFRGEAGTRKGRGTQEYVFKRDDDDGRWYVVAEQMLDQTESRTTTPEEEGTG